MVTSRLCTLPLPQARGHNVSVCTQNTSTDEGLSSTENQCDSSMQAERLASHRATATLLQTDKPSRKIILPENRVQPERMAAYPTVYD